MKPKEFKMPCYNLEEIERKYGEIVAKKIKVIQFYEKYGEKLTREAFNIAKSTVFLWKKKLKDKNYDVSALMQSGHQEVGIKEMVKR